MAQRLGRPAASAPEALQAPDPSAEFTAPRFLYIEGRGGLNFRRGRSRLRWRLALFVSILRVSSVARVKGVLGAPGEDGFDFAVRRAAADPAAHAVLDHGGAAGRPLDARAAAVLFRAARPTAAGACDRPRLPAWNRLRAAARVLARRARLSRRRHVRRLSAFADLHRRHLLGGAQSRPRRGRRNPCRDGGAADGRRRGVLGADAGVWTGDPRHAALGHAAVSLLARGAPRRIHLLARGRRRRRAAAAHDLWRIDPDRPGRAVHARPARSGARIWKRSAPGSRAWSLS